MDVEPNLANNEGNIPSTASTTTTTTDSTEKTCDSDCKRTFNQTFCASTPSTNKAPPHPASSSLNRASAPPGTSSLRVCSRSASLSNRASPAHRKSLYGPSTSKLMNSRSSFNTDSSRPAGSSSSKSTPSRKRPITFDKKLEDLEKTKIEVLEKLKEYENKELDEYYESTLKYIDKLRKQLIQIEKELCKYFIYEDADYLEDDLGENYSNKIFIANSGLEPLNALLTTHVNNLSAKISKVAGYCSVYKDDVDKMIKEIRSDGQCPILDSIVPNQTDKYDEYLLNIVERTNLYCRKKLHQDLLENRFEIKTPPSGYLENSNDQESSNTNYSTLNQELVKIKAQLQPEFDEDELINESIELNSEDESDEETEDTDFDEDASFSDCREHKRIKIEETTMDGSINQMEIIREQEEEIHVSIEENLNGTSTKLNDKLEKINSHGGDLEQKSTKESNEVINTERLLDITETSSSSSSANINNGSLILERLLQLDNKIKEILKENGEKLGKEAIKSPIQNEEMEKNSTQQRNFMKNEELENIPKASEKEEGSAKDVSENLTTTTENEKIYEIPECTTQNSQQIEKNLEENSPENSIPTNNGQEIFGKIPEDNTEILEESNENIPEKLNLTTLKGSQIISESISEANTLILQEEEAGRNIPEESERNIPEESGIIIPKESERNIREESGIIIPKESERNIRKESERRNYTEENILDEEKFKENFKEDFENKVEKVGDREASIESQNSCILIDEPLENSMGREPEIINLIEDDEENSQFIQEISELDENMEEKRVGIHSEENHGYTHEVYEIFSDSEQQDEEEDLGSPIGEEILDETSENSMEHDCYVEEPPMDDNDDDEDEEEADDEYVIVDEYLNEQPLHCSEASNSSSDCCEIIEVDPKEIEARETQQYFDLVNKIYGSDVDDDDEELDGGEKAEKDVYSNDKITKNKQEISESSLDNKKDFDQSAIIKVPNNSQIDDDDEIILIDSDSEDEQIKADKLNNGVEVEKNKSDGELEIL